MPKIKKTDNIILRVTSSDHNSIRIKSKLFGKSKSNYIRHCVFSHWENLESTSHFKELLRMYKEGDKEIKDEVVELLFHYYRENGFPHNKLNDIQKENRLKRVINSKNVLLEDNHLQMNPQGIDLANHFHPHMMEAYYSIGTNSPFETFNDDEKLKDCINRWLELEKVPNHAGMRRILKTRNGTKGVVNYKPTIAKFIYDRYCPENGKVLDPCAGYGGRLVGCIASNKNIFYHGIDPVGETAVGNSRIASFFSKQYDVFMGRVYNYRFRFDQECAEEVMPNIKERYDLVFTSPPYHSQEIYSDNISQSSSKHKEYENWLRNFLYVIVDESKRILKDDGKLVLNVKNLQKKKIADDLCKYCEKDWELETTYHMRLSNNEFNRKGDKMFHTEPIFVWKKK